MPIDLYYLPFSPPSRAVYALTKVLGLEVNLKNVDLRNGDHLAPEFIKLNPNHTIPVLVDDEFTVFESGAIMAYLINKYQPNSTLYPTDPQKRAKIDQAYHFLSSSLGPAARGVMYPKMLMKQEPPQEAIACLKEKMAVSVALIGDQKFLTGDELTIADITLGAGIPSIGLLSSDFIPTALNQYLERVFQACPELKSIMDEVSQIPLP